MHPLDRVKDAMAAHGCPVGANGQARCPNHEDKNPSLHVAMGDTAVVMTCHAGCETTAIVERIGLKMGDLFLEERKSSLGPIEAVYDYPLADGSPWIRVRRHEGKQFRQDRWENGEWVPRLGDRERVLFRLPELLDEISMGSTVYVTEGEKDALAIVKAGGVATCNPGGACKWRSEYGRVLSNAERIVIVADYDARGFEHADMVATSLNGATYEIVVAASGKDAYDHLAAGYGLDDFVKRAATLTAPESEPPAPERTPPQQPEPIYVRVRAANEFRMRPVLWLPGFEGFVPLGMLSILAGLPGLGKSMFATYLAAGASRRGEIVLIAAAEDSIEHTLLPRLVAIGADLRNVKFADIKGASIKLPDHEHLLRAAVEEHAPRILILDPIGSFMGRTIDVWKDTDVRGALDPLKQLAEDHMMALPMLAHLSKGTGPFLNRLANSVAFGQVVRSGMLWARDPDDPEGEDGDRRLLVSAKLNVGHRPEGHVYRIVPTSVQDDDGTSYGTARLAFVEKAKRSTDDLLALRETKGPPAPTVVEAMDQLRSFLADGPRPRKDVLAAAKKDWDISRTTIDKAFENLNCKSELTGTVPPVATWRLP